MKVNQEQIQTEWLVLSCQLSDEESLTQLLQLWYPKLLRYATKSLNDSAKAEDAVQNTMETLAKSIRNLKEPASFPKWIYRILNNKCVDLIRQTYKQSNVIEALTELPVDLEQSSEESNQSFDELIRQLPAPIYKLVHLHYLEELSTQEIGEILGIPAGTVKSRLFQARQMLREQIAKED